MSTVWPDVCRADGSAGDLGNSCENGAGVPPPRTVPEGLLGKEQGLAGAGAPGGRGRHRRDGAFRFNTTEMTANCK